MAQRDPHEVLGVSRGASQASIKAAFRRLARENHPDVAGSDSAAARRATRRMAEINRAYETLRQQAAERQAGRDGSAWPGPAAAGPDDGGPRRGGPLRSRRPRPVTGRVDMSQTFRPRNATTTPGGPDRPSWAHSQPRARRVDEPLRASVPNGPLRRARRRRRGATGPSLEAARSAVVEFGKFHGHTLGEIAVFEPAYIDWLAATMTRDVDLRAAALVVRADLDARGVVRRVRPPRPGAPGRPSAGP